MKLATTPLRSFLMLVALLASASQSHAQGTLQWTVTFDGGPYLLPSNEVAINYYSEQGMVFTPVGTGQFGRSGGAPVNTAFPRNGTAYLFGSFTYSLAGSSLDGAPFALVSVDLAEFSTLYQTPLTVQFIGYRADGSTVATEFVTDGIIDGAGPLADFQTFYFDSQFVNLARVEVPTYGWSLDNMVFSDAVPEPSSFALLLVSGALVCTLRRRRCGPK
jgi:hypothetical protein